MRQAKAILENDGKISIPTEYFQTLDIQIGDQGFARLEPIGVQIVVPERAIRNAQAHVHQYISAGRKLSAELIEQRREES